MSMSIPVAYAAKPFGGDVWRDVRPEGQTLAEIVASVPGLPTWFEDYGAVCVDGVPVPRRYWSRRPDECTRRLVPKVRAESPVWVTLHVVPQGGGNDTKKIVSIVASVALLAVGALITGGAAAGLGGLLVPGLFGAGSTSAALLAAGVTTLGRLALTLLSPPAAREKAVAAAPVLGSAGATGNALQPGGPIARVCGRLKIFPSFGSLPLVELNGDDEVVEASYLLAGPHLIEDIRIEGAPIEDIQGVQYYVNDGLARGVTSILGRYGVQRSPNFELQGHRRDNNDPKSVRNPSNPESDLPTWRIETTAMDPDEVWLQLTWPAGMTNSNNNRKVAMPVRIRMREVGTKAWTRLPELMFRNNKAGAITKKIVLKWGDPPSPLGNQPELYGAWHSFHTVPPQNLAPIGAGGWNAHSSFQGNPSILNDTLRVVRAYDGFTVYLDPTVFPRGNRWEVGIIRGCLIDANPFVPATYEDNGSSSTVRSYFDYWRSLPDFWIPSAAIYTDTILDRVVLSRVASVRNQTPLPIAGDASIEVRARNVQLAQLSCVASGLVPDWDGAEWTGSVASSTPWRNLEAKFVRAALFWRLQGFAFVAGVLRHNQGEGNYARTKANHLAGLVKFRDDWQALALAWNALRTSGGFPGKAPFLVTQMVNGNFYTLPTSEVPWAQLQINLDDATTALCAGPNYDQAHLGDGVHLTAAGHEMQGARQAVAYAEWLKGNMWYPLHVRKDAGFQPVRTGTTVRLRIRNHFNLPLVFDTAAITGLGASQGFAWKDDGNGNAVTVTNATIIDSTTVDLTLSAIPTGTNGMIDIAMTGGSGLSAGPVTGNRSSLRTNGSGVTTRGGRAVEHFICIDRVAVI